MRVSYIDVAKGMSILLVAIGHSHLIGPVEYDPINSGLSTFRLPFFAMISGVFFSYHYNLSQYTWYRFDTLVKPFLTVVVTLVLWRLLTEGITPETLISSFRMLYGNGITLGWPWAPIWFLPHLWVVSVFAVWLLQRVQFDTRSTSVQVLVVAALFIAGMKMLPMFYYRPLSALGLPYNIPGLPYSIDVVPLTAAYFVLGYLLKPTIRRFEPRLLTFTLSVSAITLIAIEYDIGLDLNSRLVRSPLMSLLASMAGIYCALSLAYLLAKQAVLSKYLTYFGQQSLFILLFHNVIMQALTPVLGNMLGEPGRLLAIVLAIAVPTLLGQQITRSRWLSLLFRPSVRKPEKLTMASKPETAGVLLRP